MWYFFQELLNGKGVDDRQVYRWVNRQRDRWTAGQMDNQTDRQTDRQTDTDIAAIAAAAPTTLDLYMNLYGIRGIYRSRSQPFQINYIRHTG